MNSLVLVPLSIVAAGLCYWLFWFVYGRVAAGLVLVLGLFLVETWFSTLPDLKIGLSVYPHDVVFLLLFVVGLFRLLSVRGVSGLGLAWCAFGALQFGLFFLGLPIFGTRAGVEFRESFYLWAGATYFMSFDWARDLEPRLPGAWRLAAILVLLIVALRWGNDLVGLNLLQRSWEEESGSLPLRVVNAARAVFLVYALVFAIYARLGKLRERPVFGLIPVLGITILFLQHRTAWVCAFASCLLIVFLEGRSRWMLLRTGAGFAFLGATLLVPFLALGYLDGALAVISNAFSEATHTEHSTFLGRVEGWKLLMQDWLNSEPLTHLFGYPFGTGYFRVQEGSGEGGAVGWAPHNFYVQTILRGGIVGLALLLGVYVTAIARLYRRGVRRAGGVTGSGYLIVALVVQLIYFITYSPHLIDSVLLGCALALAQDLAPARSSALGFRPRSSANAEMAS
jgi:hypothetical protein